MDNIWKVTGMKTEGHFYTASLNPRLIRVLLVWINWKTENSILLLLRKRSAKFWILDSLIIYILTRKVNNISNSKYVLTSNGLFWFMEVSQADLTILEMSWIQNGTVSSSEHHRIVKTALEYFWNWLEQ